MSRASLTEGPSIESLPQRHAAVLVLDVDEVVLHFVEPFAALLEEHGARLHFDSFALTGNVRSLATGEAISGHQVSGLTERLYAEQENRQTVVDGVAPALERLSMQADIVFLTAMTPRFHSERRRLLDHAGLTYPMIATERSKGAVVAELGRRWQGPLAFVDDLPPNLEGVRRSLARAKLLQLMAHDGLRPHLPALPAGARQARNWAEAEPILTEMLASEGP